jgi:hypothetical protein
VTLYDLLAEGQADAGAGIFFPGVQAGKDLKYALGLIGLEANAVIAYRKAPFTFTVLGRDVHTWGLGPAKLEGILQQVLEQPLQL